MFRTLFIVLLLLNFHNLFALQTLSIRDNNTVLVKIAANEQSRIFIKNDRIAVVRGLDGAYDLKKDDQRGDIYIRPTPYFQHKAFNLFITSEQGHTYNLLASPLEIPSETIQLKPLTASHVVATRWERNSPYQQTIINLISTMTNDRTPDGYAVISLGKQQTKSLNNNLTMQLTTIYKGEKLQGEIWLLKNVSKNIVTLSPSQFYSDKVLGISISQESLFPSEMTYLYRVVRNDE